VCDLVTHLCLISGLCRSLVEIFARVSVHATLLGSLPTFRYSLSVPSSKVKQSDLSFFHSTWTLSYLRGINKLLSVNQY